MKYKNQVAIITGGASGMGKACAETLRALGMKVAIWDQKEVQSDREIKYVHCDVASEISVNEALTQTIELLGPPRVCINCAGIAPAKKMVSKDGVMPLANFTQVIQVNLIGSFNVMCQVSAAMMSLDVLTNINERGIIINTASIAAFEGQIGQMAYSASKGGIVGMTLTAARELAAHAIRVNTIAPGLVGTPMLLNMPQEVQDSLAATVVFPKRLAHAQEFADLAVHMIENQYLNGEVIRLDGALRMQPR